MFAVIGLMLTIYVAYAMFQGEVVAKNGVRARTVSRAKSPVYFWTCVIIYGVLAIALVTVF